MTLATFEKYRSLTSHPGFVRCCAIVLILGAMLGMIRTFLALSFLIVGADPISYLFPEGFFYLVGYSVISSVLFLAIGTLGIRAVLPNGMERLKKLMTVGILISIIATLSLLIGVTYELLVIPESGYPNPLLNAIFLFGNFVGPFGLLMAGIAALWVRSLVFARFFVLLASLWSFPLLIDWLFTYFIYLRFGYDSPVVEVMYSSLQVPSGLLWITVGIVLFGAKEREAKFVGREREDLGRVNLEIARRLYEEAWVKGEYEVLEEYVSPEVVDAYHEEVGLANFRRNVAGLRRSFPDLDFEIEAQTPDADTVTTRWNLTGTDAGGILWYPPTREKVSLSGTFTDRFEDGILVEHRGTSDMRSLIDRLGLG